MAKNKLDGFGRPVDPTAHYYVQDARSVVGNCMSLWCPKGAGYTCEVDKAGVYVGSDVLAMRTTDVPWPVEAVRAASVRHVRADQIHRFKPEEKGGAA